MSAGLFSGWIKIVGSNAAGGVLQLLAMAVVARALDLEAFGVLVLVQTYVKIIDGLLNFQSVNVLTRFLAEAEHAGDTVRLRGLVKAGLLVDGVTALFSMCVAMLALPLVAPLSGIPPEWVGPGIIFSVVIATRILGVSEALLRCFDRFGAIGLRVTVQGALLLVASLVAWAAGAGPLAFLWIWLATEVVANLGFVWFAMTTARRHGIGDIADADARTAIAGSAGFWPMLWQTNATFAMRMVSQDADVAVAGALLGPPAAALLRAAKNVSAVVSQLGRPLQQVASAPIARLAAAGDLRGALLHARNVSLLAGGGALVVTAGVVLLGEWGLQLLYGAPYGDAHWPLVAYFLAATIFMFGVALLPLAITLGEGGLFLRATIGGTLAFIALLATLTPMMGVMGIALAQLGYTGVWLVWAWTGLALSARRKIRSDLPVRVD